MLRASVLVYMAYVPIFTQGQPNSDILREAKIGNDFAETVDLAVDEDVMITT